MAWHAVAIALHPETTAHGIMIRGQIPTQPSTGGAGAGQARLTVDGGIGLANFTFTLRGRLVGEPDFADVAVGLMGPTHQQLSITPATRNTKSSPTTRKATANRAKS